MGVKFKISGNEPCLGRFLRFLCHGKLFFDVDFLFLWLYQTVWITLRANQKLKANGQTIGYWPHSQVALDFLMVLRVIRIFKIFHSVTRFRIVINTILHILPSMFTYGGVLLVFYYFFALIGMEAFGGKVRYFGYDVTHQSTSEKYCGNPRLKDSDFYRDKYCSNVSTLHRTYCRYFRVTCVKYFVRITTDIAIS